MKRENAGASVLAIGAEARTMEEVRQYNDENSSRDMR
jgi:hypothetical protein